MQNAEHYFSTARERYSILLKRQAGEPPPWTEDSVLRAWRFCCVHREDDKTTEWFRENVRAKLDDTSSREAAVKLVTATIAFRWFNRIETGERILDLLLGQWDSAEVYRRLEHVAPIVSGAYIISAYKGMDKLSGVLKCIDESRDMVPDYVGVILDARERHLESMWAMLRNVPFMGPFMAYEVVTDLRWTSLLSEAVDINTWANAGPGCARGIGWVVNDNPRTFNRGSRHDQEEMLEYMKDLLEMSKSRVYWPQDWPRWEMREVEHWSCEYDKYRRGAAGEKLKRRFR